MADRVLNEVRRVTLHGQDVGLYLNGNIAKVGGVLITPGNGLPTFGAYDPTHLYASALGGRQFSASSHLWQLRDTANTVRLLRLQLHQTAAPAADQELSFSLCHGTRDGGSGAGAAVANANPGVASLVTATPFGNASAPGAIIDTMWIGTAYARAALGSRQAPILDLDFTRWPIPPSAVGGGPYLTLVQNSGAIATLTVTVNAWWVEEAP